MKFFKRNFSAFSNIINLTFNFLFEIQQHIRNIAAQTLRRYSIFGLLECFKNHFRFLGKNFRSVYRCPRNYWDRQNIIHTSNLSCSTRGMKEVLSKQNTLHSTVISAQISATSLKPPMVCPFLPPVGNYFHNPLTKKILKQKL